MQHEFTGRVPDRVLLSAALILLTTFLALAIGVTQHRLDSFDQAARALVHRPSHPLLQSSMETASLVGGRWRGPTAVSAAAVVATVAARRMCVDGDGLCDVLGVLGIGLACLGAVVWLIGSFPPRVARGES